MAFKDYPLDPALVETIGDSVFIGPNMARNDVRPALQQFAADGRGLFDEFQAVIQFIQSFAAGLNTPLLMGVDGTGLTDVSAQLQAALDTGGMVYLPAGKVYSFGAQLHVPSGGGFYGPGTLRMLTGTGKFDSSDYTGTAFAKSGIYVNGKSNVRIQCKIDMETNAGIRTCNPITVNSSTNVDLDVEITGFKEAQYGLIEWNTNVGGRVKAYVHDCGTTITTGLASLQITALSVDNNRIGGINSRDLWFDVFAKNLTQSAPSITAYGNQTDGVNLQGNNATGESGAGYGGHTGTVRAENVGEALDVFSDHNNVTVTARDCLFGVKITHGARHNVIRATVHNFEKAACFISGTNTGVRTTSFNRVSLTATGGGDIGSYSDVTAALIDGTGMTYGCDNNVIEVTSQSAGVNLDYIAAVGGGDNNVINYEGSGWALAADRVYSGSGNQLRRKRKTHVRAYKSVSSSIANDTTVVFNTETKDVHGEYDPTTGVFTAKATTTLRVKVMWRVSGVSTGATYGSYIRKGVAVVSRKNDENTGATGDLWHEHSALVDVVPGDTIFIRTDSGAATHTYTGDEAGTYIEIQEL